MAKFKVGDRVNIHWNNYIDHTIFEHHQATGTIEQVFDVNNAPAAIDGTLFQYLVKHDQPIDGVCLWKDEHLSYMPIEDNKVIYD